MLSFANAAVNAFSIAGTGTTTAAFDAVLILNANVAIKANAHVYTPHNNTIIGNGTDLGGALSSTPPK